MSWKFASITLKVLDKPAPSRTAGYRKIAFAPPGHNGLSTTIDDGRMPVTVAMTVEALSYAEYAQLSALFESGSAGDLEIPENADSWVYHDAYAESGVQWEIVWPDTLWRCRVTFVCPDPRPKWLSTGAYVY